MKALCPTNLDFPLKEWSGQELAPDGTDQDLVDMIQYNDGPNWAGGDHF